MFKRAHKAATCPYRVWEEGNHPQAITSEAMTCRKIDCIHHNPVARGYVDSPEPTLFQRAGLSGAIGIDRGLPGVVEGKWELPGKGFSSKLGN
uniref:Uncharacterized protein n=1 Tax=Candidatus Kentrum sp. FM TaxID=2126340 RepID=A0A450T3Q4_9GAMM|nr:MAG: hypothetical protein BECKFM1743C_GA0114222_100173 [Candidatus Kentron sp. FM]VFJ61189.1 MAG: hypothetical protein BECKFM1743A_GA0114220_102803 [Candidatus Kentron sp. FM]VFK11436.1 MAG: hypothetical protein BECKFM1743B_GA0114221_101823 [Candidatus Kentron sp. FM]